MSLDYTYEKLSVAVGILATSPNSLKDRIEDAFNSSIIHIFPEDDLPEYISEQLKEMQNQLTQIKAEAKKGTLNSPIQTISEEEAIEIAKKIWDLFTQVNYIFLSKKDLKP